MEESAREREINREAQMNDETARELDSVGNTLIGHSLFRWGLYRRNNGRTSHSSSYQGYRLHASQVLATESVQRVYPRYITMCSSESASRVTSILEK
jgi:hypothetical protein